jgi:hypothetical protein
MPRTPFASFASIEFRVTMAPAAEPWNTVTVERFTGSSAERDAQRMAESLEGIENAIIGVCCAQCL